LYKPHQPQVYPAVPLKKLSKKLATPNLPSIVPRVVLHSPTTASPLHLLNCLLHLLNYLRSDPPSPDLAAALSNLSGGKLAISIIGFTILALINLQSSCQGRRLISVIPVLGHSPSSAAYGAVSFYFKGGQRENIFENKGSGTSLDRVNRCGLISTLQGHELSIY
jgi:hypothetical protein